MQRSVDLVIGIIAALGASACSSTKTPLPPPFEGNAIENPVSCKQLQAGQIVGKEIHLDGGVPNCGATGLRCPLPGVSPSVQASVCGPRSMVAACEQNQWKLVCEGPLDASSPADAGGDAADAAQVDAAAD